MLAWYQALNEAQNLVVRAVASISKTDALVNRRCGLIAKLFCKLFVNRSTNCWSTVAVD
jgi:hypothetical protein